MTKRNSITAEEAMALVAAAKAIISMSELKGNEETAQQYEQAIDALESGISKLETMVADTVELYNAETHGQKH